MPQTYRMILQYEGTRYNGWQKQGNTPNTLQQKLETLLSRLAGEAVEVHGSGRTDAGVHALGQTASFTLRRPLPAEEVMARLNAALPKDIAVAALAPAPPRFHARLNAVGKTYRYRIHQGPVPDVFGRRWSWQCPWTLEESALRAAVPLLVGRRDFAAFSDYKGNKSTLRTLEDIRIYREGFDLVLDFSGEGFLYHMVRILTGTLAEIGAGRLPPEALPEIFASRDRKRAGPLAPACGLTLVSVDYPPEALS